MKDTDGGFIFLLAIAAALLLGGCAASRPVIGGPHDECTPECPCGG